MATTAQLRPAARGTAGAPRLGEPRRCATAPDLGRSRASSRGSSARVALFGRGAASGGTSSGGRTGGLVPFPKDYDQMIAQCQKALQAALDDGVPLMELQFPPGGLDTVPGDVEGNVENNLTTAHLRGVCAQFERNKTSDTTRVFFPDPVERNIALTGAANTPDGVRPPDNAQTKAFFADWSGAVDFLEAPDFFSVSGLDKVLNKRVSLSDRVAKQTEKAGKKRDTAFVVAYPSLNISELVRTKELYDGELRKEPTERRPVITCNGELERTRSNYYPPFWNAKEMAPLRDFAREFEGVYWISNFKGSNPAVLFRAYPGPWQVLRRRRADDSYEVVYTCDEFPGVQKVALEILPKFP
jgi:hypothetical protein